MSTEEPEGTQGDEKDPSVEELTAPKRATDTSAIATTGSLPKEVAATESRRVALREKAAQVTTAQNRRRRITRAVIGVVVFAIVAAVGVTVWWVVSSAASKAQATPQNITNGGFVITEEGVSGISAAGNGTLTTGEATPEPTEPAADATADATPEPTTQPVEVAVFVDFMDPDAAAFQSANAKQLASWVRQGAVTLTYYPVATLNGQSEGTKFSQRAMAATACVSTYAPDSVFGYIHELLAAQPKVDTAGLTDSDLADIAASIGMAETKKVRTCIEDGRFMSWAKKQTDSTIERSLGDREDVLANPAVILVNGAEYVGGMDNPDEFAQIVLRKSSDEYFATPTPTPEATPSPEPAATTPAEATPEPTPTQ